MTVMKDNLHPKVYTNAKVICSCGATYTTTSTLETINVEVCSNCHPFYTGVDKFVDTEGIVVRFQKKQEVAKQKQEERKVIDDRKKAASAKTQTGPLTLKDLLKHNK